MRNKKILMRTVQTILAIGITLIMLFPIYWMINTALKPSSELLLPVPRFWPSQVDFGSFLMAWEKVPLGRYLFNTAFVTFWSLFFQIGNGNSGSLRICQGAFPGQGFAVPPGDWRADGAAAGDVYSAVHPLLPAGLGEFFSGTDPSQYSLRLFHFYDASGVYDCGSELY